MDKHRSEYLDPPLPHSGTGAELLEYVRLALNLPQSLVSLDLAFRVNEPLHIKAEFNATHGR